MPVIEMQTFFVRFMGWGEEIFSVTKVGLEIDFIWTFNQTVLIMSKKTTKYTRKSISKTNFIQKFPQICKCNAKKAKYIYKSTEMSSPEHTDKNWLKNIS